MITKKRLYSLSIIAIFSTAALHSMDPSGDDQGQKLPAREKTPQEELYEAQKYFYEQKAASSRAMQDLQDKIQGTRGHTERAVITKAVDLAGTWTDRGITTAFNELRKKNGWLTEEEEISLQINRELRIAKEKENILTESTTATKKAEEIYYNSQTLNAEIDAAIKLCQGRASSDTQCRELTEELFKKLKEQTKK